MPQPHGHTSHHRTWCARMTIALSAKSACPKPVYASTWLSLARSECRTASVQVRRHAEQAAISNHMRCHVMSDWAAQLANVRPDRSSHQGIQLSQAADQSAQSVKQSINQTVMHHSAAELLHTDQTSSRPSTTAVCQLIARHSRAAAAAASESWLCRVGSHAAGKSANTSCSLDASILYLYSGPTLGYVLLYYSLPIADCCKPSQPLHSRHRFEPSRLLDIRLPADGAGHLPSSLGRRASAQQRQISSVDHACATGSWMTCGSTSMVTGSVKAAHLTTRFW